MPEQPDHMFNQAFEMASDEEIAKHIKQGQPPFRCKIAGMPHRKPDLSVLSIGTEVTLVAEPHNAFDPNAIKVMHNGVHLGYIPKTDTYMVSGVAKMKVVRIAPEDKWNEVHIETF